MLQTGRTSVRIASKGTASFQSLSRFPMSGLHQTCFGGGIRSGSCSDRADAADGDRGAVPPSAHHEAGAGTQDPSVLAARRRDHAAELGVGDGHHLNPDGAWLRPQRRRRSVDVGERPANSGAATAPTSCPCAANRAALGSAGDIHRLRGVRRMSMTAGRNTASRGNARGLRQQGSRKNAGDKKGVGPMR